MEANEQFNQPITESFNKTNIQNIEGFIEVVDVAPTHTPRTLWDQMKFCTADSKLYIYDYKTHAWLSASFA